MFYSHHLLARKAPLGQIWMAATMHAKINRRKLDKLDIIKICEEILNPTVPMALRLSGILMGGVVIVYERKVKLLYDDVNRFLIEINEAWKVKPAVDPTVLPKGKAQAKFEAVTLPNMVEMETEQTMHFSDDLFTAAKLQRMRLDDVDEQFINISIRDEDPSQQHHQAEAANITLVDNFGSCLDETYLYNRFERFDIGEDEETTHANFTPQEQPTLAPSPPRNDARSQPPTSPIASPPQHEPQQAENQPMDEQADRQPESHTVRVEEAEGDVPEQKPSRKRKVRQNLTRVIMDDEQIMIPGNIYQSWLQDTSSITSRRGRRNKSFNPILNTKVAKLMEIPPVALLSGPPDEVIYSPLLLKLWKKCTETLPDIGASSGASPPVTRGNPVSHSHSPPQGLSHRSVPSFVPDDFHSVIGSQSMASSVEKLMAEQGNMDPQSIFNDAVRGDQFDFPMSPARQSSRSAPSSGSGHALIPSPEELLPASTRARKRQYSSARSNFGNLDPVEEEGPLEQDGQSFKIPRQSQKGPPFDSELLEETGPTQTPHPMITDPSADSITQSIRTHLKLHFDTPGAPQSESVEQLANGMNRKKAAQLFYQTCVLATLDYVKVYQAEAYGDILISRGPKM